jgi:hypothetical protein
VLEKTRGDKSPDLGKDDGTGKENAADKREL